VSPTGSSPDRVAEIAAEIAALGPALPGTLLQRHSRCNNPGCHCHADPPTLHGPYWQWTRKRHGKTVTRRVSTDHVDDYRHWLANHHRLRELVTELEDLALATTDQITGRTPHSTGTDKTPQNSVDPAR